jgi:hypothetical protein
LEYHGETGENDINGGKKTDDCVDNLCDFAVDEKKKFDEAEKKRKMATCSRRETFSTIVRT